MKKAGIWLAVIAALAVIGYFAYTNSSGGETEEYVTEAVTKGSLSSFVSATGKVNPKVSVLVGSEVSGTIRQIYVDNNSVVKKGQVLVRLDQETFTAQLEQAEAKLASAEAHVKELDSSREQKRASVKNTIDEKESLAQKAAADAERQKLLYKRGAISRQDMDNALSAETVALAQYRQSLADKANYDVIDAQIEVARASAREARAGVTSAKTNLSKTVITAPMDGVVINRNVEVGQTVAASFSTPELMDIGDLGVMEVEVSIDEADVGRAMVGQDAKFTVDAFPGKEFRGKLSEVYYAPVEVQNVVTYSGIVEVENPERTLRPGMTANVEIITAERKDALLIPNAALRVKLDLPEARDLNPPPGKRVVFVLKDGKPTPAFIETGVTDFVHTEVVSGLYEGDQVVVESIGEGEESKRQETTRRPRGMMGMGH